MFDRFRGRSCYLLFLRWCALRKSAILIKTVSATRRHLLPTSSTSLCGVWQPFRALLSLACCLLSPRSLARRSNMRSASSQLAKLPPLTVALRQFVVDFNQ
jgi:hypothetical protein